LIFLIGLIFSLKSTYLHADEFKVHVIKPRLKVRWNSPSSLGITSGLNSITKDYAPIGHFAVELNCSQELSNGVSKVLTGMERVNKKESKRITLKNKLGLGGMIYSFKGSLVSEKVSRMEIQKAKKQRRLKTLVMPISKVDCHRGLLFIEKWIKHGSYKVYGGNKDSIRGEGGGCADFMSTLFKVITGLNPPSEWFVKLRIPRDLIGDGDLVRVPFTKVLTRFRWAKDGEDSVQYQTADTNSAYRWLRKRSKRNESYYYTKHLFKTKLMYSNSPDPLNTILEAAERSELSSPLEPFLYHYETSAIEETKVWKSIKLQD
jgi:hypothetical protein